MSDRFELGQKEPAIRLCGTSMVRDITYLFLEDSFLLFSSSRFPSK